MSLADDTTEMFLMVSKPKGKAASAIQLSQDIWRVEDELDLLYSSARNAYVSYKETGKSETLLGIDGTLQVYYPSEEDCKKKFEEMKKKIKKAGTLPKLVYDELTLKSYRISKKIQGKLEDVIPNSLLEFLTEEAKEKKYDPKQVSFEFAEKQEQKDFIKVTFDKAMKGDKLLLDLTVESNDASYAKRTIKQVEQIIKK